VYTYYHEVQIGLPVASDVVVKKLVGKLTADRGESSNAPYTFNAYNYIFSKVTGGNRPSQPRQFYTHEHMQNR
jgi:hypothetical protein